LETVDHCSKCSSVLKLCLFCDSIIRAASRRSRSDTTLYRSNTLRVLCPLILIATASGYATPDHVPNCAPSQVVKK